MRELFELFYRVLCGSPQSAAWLSAQYCVALRTVLWLSAHYSALLHYIISKNRMHAVFSWAAQVTWGGYPHSTVALRTVLHSDWLLRSHGVALRTVTPHYSMTSYL